MRLTQEQVRLIVDVVSRWAGPGADAYLFGSRLNDAVSGGDVVIFIEADNALSLGLPVDIIAHVRTSALTPLQIIARADAARLEV